ncbi:MAG: alkaline phosphatase family protein [Thaumarchaeota archaeon]|nr:alkaline phosphatase family protein [Nitrososphaerota archaeon]
MLGLDGLEYHYVEEFGCKNLMQKSYGMTDISEFKEPRTVVIWSSFLAGKNLEERVLKEKELWSFKLKPEETFFSKFEKWEALDVPGFTYNVEMHKRERELLKGFFEKKNTIEDYDKVALEDYKKMKEEFFEAIGKDYEIVMGYFALADVIGHLSFGVKAKMKLIYEELDSLAREAREYADDMLIVSDHGMKAVGRFGDHSDHGFWSIGRELDLGRPRITYFYRLIEGLRKA